MAKASGNNVKWYRSKYDKNMFLRVDMRPLPAVSYIKTAPIYRMDTFQVGLARTTSVWHERVFGLMATVNKLYVQIPSKELPKSVRRSWSIM